MSSKVTIVEDDNAIQLMYKLKLQREGFQVSTASNGREGLRVIRRFSPELVLLDLRMPEMDGVEMLARLRAASWGSGIRVIVLTNISKNEAPQALRFFNVDRYIVKAHYTPSQVVAVVNEVLEIKPSST